MTAEQLITIKGYIATLNSNVTPGALLDLVIDTTVDRVLLYLNETALDEKLNRVVAQIVVNVYGMTTSQSNASGSDRSVASATDNGQQIQYTVKPNQYLYSAKDQELFSGFERLLQDYRRPHVIAG